MASEIIELACGSRRLRFSSPPPQRLTPSERRRQDARFAYARAQRQQAALIESGEVDAALDREPRLHDLRDEWVAAEAQVEAEAGGLVRPVGQGDGDDGAVPA